MTTPFDNTSNPFAETPNSVQQQPEQVQTHVPAAPAVSDPFAGQPQAQEAAPPQQQTTFNASEAPAANPFATNPVQQPPAQQPMQQQQSPLGGYAQAPNSFGSNSGGQKTKYKILDLYWLVNMKLYQQQQLDQNECAILSISYNVDFDNLRIGFVQPNNDTFTKSSISVRNVNKITNVNVYSEGAEQIIDLIGLAGDGQIQNLERVFNTTWAPNETIFAKQGDNIIIHTTHKDGVSTFTLQEWQKRALNHACVFMLKEARVLALSKFGV